MRTIITLFLFVVSFNISNAQIIGKIFDKDFADKEFGEVVKFIEIDNNSLTNLTDIAEGYMIESLQNKFIKVYQIKYIDSIFYPIVVISECFYRKSNFYNAWIPSQAGNDKLFLLCRSSNG